MSSSKDDPQTDPVVEEGSRDEPSGARPPDPEQATVVEGDAVELPAYPAPDAADPPVSAPVTPVYEPEPFEARAYASSTSAPAAPAASRRGWPDAGVDLAERPEYVVGAAFGGGLLLALILRKLGH